jgi:RNA polymerase sigma factor (sigma-70 family)
MPQSSPLFGLSEASEGSFGNTDWWMVRQAGRPGQPEADPARSSLCQAYWKPVFHYILRAGHPWHDAQDLTQEFFARVLERNSLHTAAREKGRFRSFVLTLLKRFLADQCARDRCQKRGGGTPVFSLDSGDTEFRRRLEPIDRLDPETICEREWVASLVQDALARVELECASRGRAEVFRGMKGLITGDGEVSCAEVAAKLHLSEANVRVIVHRLRQRLRQLLSYALAEAGSPRTTPKSTCSESSAQRSTSSDD